MPPFNLLGDDCTFRENKPNGNFQQACPARCCLRSSVGMKLLSVEPSDLLKDARPMKRSTLVWPMGFSSPKRPHWLWMPGLGFHPSPFLLPFSISYSSSLLCSASCSSLAWYLACGYTWFIYVRPVPHFCILSFLSLDWGLERSLLSGLSCETAHLHGSPLV